MKLYLHEYEIFNIHIKESADCIIKRDFLRYFRANKRLKKYN